MILRLIAILSLITLTSAKRTKVEPTTTVPIERNTGAGNIDPDSSPPYANRCYGYDEGSDVLPHCERKTPKSPDKGPKPPSDPPCPSPLSANSVDKLKHLSQAKLRSCNSNQFETLSYQQVEALDDNPLMMEKSVQNPTKLANLIEKSEQSEVDAVPWEHVADKTDGDVFNAMTDSAFAKMPTQRVLPYMSRGEFEKVDLNKCLTEMSTSNAEDMDWSNIGYKISPDQMSEIEPDNIEKMEFDKMWEYMDRQSISKVTPDQFKAMDSKQLDNMNERAIGNLEPQTLGQLTPDQVSGMDDVSKLYTITPQQAAVMSNTNPDVFGELPTDVIQKLDPAVVKQLTPDAVNSLGADKLSSMSSKQLASLKPSAVSQLDPSIADQIDLSAFN